MLLAEYSGKVSLHGMILVSVVLKVLDKSEIRPLKVLHEVI